MAPPLCSAIPKTVARPRPVPASLFRCEERLEDLRLRLRVYSNPGVVNGQPHEAPRHKILIPGVGLCQSHVRRLNRNCAAFGHRVPRVQRKVHDHAADFSWVGVHPPERGVTIEDNLDPLAYQTAQHPVEIRD
jgi:hypothetical protein